ncbi:FecR family protein [Dongia soli]|uniref:FecR family protein n=1 Tax=Dongia soli TaxID=600628 RepID=A0ABU5E8W0_9PROT|nr:FecR family protein [Dongia soli]MDY0882204.1 FecR family protein [Dongia soli]
MILPFADRFSSDRALLMTRRGFARGLIGTAALTTSLSMSFAFTAGTADAATDRTALGSVKQMRQLAGASFEKETRLLHPDDKVFQSDLLWTRDGGQLLVAMFDGSSLSLGENAEVRLDDSLASNPVSGFLRILGGAFRFNSGKAEKPAESPKIHTPFAILSLRGTDVFGGRFEKSYDIFVFSGEVEVRNDAGAVILTSGYGTSLTASNVPPTRPKIWGDAKIKRARAMVGD